ncbi:hypothetical protein C8E89_1581, partial [Mycolicibacterium moriokaense]
MPYWQGQSITFRSEAARRRGSAGNVTPGLMQRSIRLLQAATGNVGSEMIRRIAQRRTLELEGLHCYSPDKIGRDAGAIVGMAPVGVLATSAADDIIAARPEMVTFRTSGPAGPSRHRVCRWPRTPANPLLDQMTSGVTEPSVFAA